VGFLSVLVSAEEESFMSIGMMVRPFVFALALCAVSELPTAQRSRGKFDPLTVTCVGSTRSTLFLQVCAGASGAPAGFSIQWIDHTAVPALTCGASGQEALWPSSDGGALCKASLSGTPGCSIYNLTPFECVIIEIGNLDDAQCGVGLSNCGASELECGKEYVFRAFAHANSTRQRSDFSPNLCCSTDPCAPTCVLTQGYWNTHACAYPAPFVPGTPDPTDVDMNGVPDNLEGQCGVQGNNPNSACPADPTTTILIGGIAYTQGDLLCSLDQSGQGNALRILAHQLIAAKLNVLNGASDQGIVSASCANLPANPYDGAMVAELILHADSLIATGMDASLVAYTCTAGQPCPGTCPAYPANILTDCVRTGGAGNTLGPAMTAVAQLLDLYNNGCGGVPHCP
jgi:hypothetical protein